MSRRLPTREQLQFEFRAIAQQFIGGPKRLAIFEAGLIGLISGIAAFCLRAGAGLLGSWRVHGSVQYSAWPFLPLLGVCGGFLAGFLVERVAPEAAGSGIPQVKAALGGTKISLDLRVALVKLVGTMVTMASGFTLGRQGPTVQIGASLAAWVSRWVPTSPNYRRQLIACGAAAGLAAGFNAPIAGVLFVVEDLLHDVSGLTLGPAIIASFTGAVVSRLLGNREMGIPPTASTPAETLYQQWLIEPPEIPFYILVGILSGVFGVLFGRAIVAFQKLNRQTLKLGLPVRMAFTGLICGGVISILPETFRDNAGLREFILSGNILWTTTALAFIVQFSLTGIAAGSGAPGGIFAPSLILGAALGDTIGLWQASTINLQPHTTFAFAGMGAFFCAVSRTPVTAVVIVFEITADFNLVLPLMVCSIAAYLMAEKLDKQSLSDRLLQLNGIELDRVEQPDRTSMNALRAEDVMQRQVETLDYRLTIDQVMQAFSRSHHRGFPVVDEGKLVGIVTQTDMASIHKQEIPEDTPLYKLMTPQPVTIKPDAPLSEVLYLLGRQKLSRLPVVEGRHLVGIITRSDIIRGELGYLSGETTQVGPHPAPSYVVYQTQGPQVGNGRILVSLYNPKTAPALLHVAAAIARERNYELECLTVITVPRHRLPAETPVRSTKSRHLLREAEHIARQWQVPLHTQVRIAHDVTQAILETVKERHIDLTLIGWHGEKSTADRIFGTVVDTVVRQVPGEVVLVKWGRDIHRIFNPSARRSLQFPIWKRWLVPLRTGVRHAAAMQILPGLVNLSLQPDVRLLKVVKKNISDSELRRLDLEVENWGDRLNANVTMSVVCAHSVTDAVLDVAHKEFCDVVVLGASGEGMLQQVIHGNLPEAIARGCDCTVILVRPAMTNV